MSPKPALTAPEVLVHCLRFIPEDTEVFISPYQLHHDPRYFSPLTSVFHPERWLDDVEGKWNTQSEAYIPFSAGPMQFVGKNLAKIEIIVVVSALLRYYDMNFAEGYDPATYEELIVADVPPLPVILTKKL